MRTNFWTPAKIPIAVCYVFTIRVEGRPVEAYFSLNTTASKAFAVGQKVQIEYEERGIPPLWQRVYVMNMTRIPSMKDEILRHFNVVAWKTYGDRCRIGSVPMTHMAWSPDQTSSDLTPA